MYEWSTSMSCVANKASGHQTKRKGSVYFVRSASRMIKYVWRAPVHSHLSNVGLRRTDGYRWQQDLTAMHQISSISKLETQTMYQAFKSPKASFKSGFTTPVCKCHLAVVQSAYMPLFIPIHPTNWLFVCLHPYQGWRKQCT